MAIRVGWYENFLIGIQHDKNITVYVDWGFVHCAQCRELVTNGNPVITTICHIVVYWLTITNVNHNHHEGVEA